MRQDITNVIKAKAFFDYSKNVATENEIKALTEEINIIFDNEYLNFLRTINGFELNGLNFYGTKEQPEIYVLDVLKQNKFWSKEIPVLKDYFIIADGDMDFYCYCPMDSKYHVLSKGSVEKVEVYDNFNSFLESLLKIY